MNCVLKESSNMTESLLIKALIDKKIVSAPVFIPFSARLSMNFKKIVFGYEIRQFSRATDCMGV